LEGKENEPQGREGRKEGIYKRLRKNETRRRSSTTLQRWINPPEADKSSGATGQAKDAKKRD